MGHRTLFLPRGVKHIQKNKKVRFGAVGVINTAVDFGVLNILVAFFGAPLVIANVISTTAAMITSFILNKKTVFEDGGKAGRQIVLFLIVTVIGMWVVQTGVVALVYVLLGDISMPIKLNIAKIIGTIFSLTWNYFWYSRVVFVKNPIIFRPKAMMDMAVKHWKAIAVIASVATLVIALFMGMGRSVWFDEGYSIMLAQRPVVEMIDLTKVDAHPPLYYLFLKTWGGLFGWSELSLRLSSAIPGALSVGMMILVLRKLFTDRVAMAVTPFLVVAPFLARYNYEIRMYALVGFIGVFGTWLLLKARESKSSMWWISYVFVVALGMYTLYMSIVIWLAHALWLVYTDIHQKKNPILTRRWLYYLIPFVLLLPWVPIVHSQLSNSALPPYKAVLNLEMFINLFFLVCTYTASWGANAYVIVAMVVSVLLTGWLLFYIRRKVDKKYKAGLALLIIGFFTALIIYRLVSLSPQSLSYVERYMIPISIYFYALVGVIVYLGYQAKKRIVATGLCIIWLGLLIYGLFSLYNLGNYNFQRLQPVYAKTVKQTIGCDETTFVTSGAYGYIDMWYDFRGCDFRYFQPAELTYIGGYAPMNKYNTTDRVKNSNDLSSKKVAFIYYDDSTEFMQIDARYTFVRQLDLQGVHVKIYQRNL